MPIDRRRAQVNRYSVVYKMSEALFLVHEENAAYLKDRSRPPKIESDRVKGIGCFLYFFLFATFFMLVMTVVEWRNYTVLQNRGEVVTGRYTDKFTESHEGDIVYKVVYSFTVNDTTYSNDQNVSGAFYQQVQLNTPTDIIYDLQNPDLSSLIAFNVPPRTLTFVMLGTAMVTLGLLYVAMRTQQRFKRLGQEGKLIYGKVLFSRAYKDSEDDRYVEILYMFANPDTGETIEGRFNRISRLEAPQRKETVAVIYQNPNFFRLL